MLIQVKVNSFVKKNSVYSVQADGKGYPKIKEVWL